MVGCCFYGIPQRSNTKSFGPTIGSTFPKAKPLVAHRNERNSPSPGRRLISKLRLAPSQHAALLPVSPCRQHVPTPRRLCQRQTGPIFISAQARRFPHRAGKGQPSLAWFLALPQGSERPIGASPHVQSVSEQSSYTDLAVSVGVTRVPADAPDVAFSHF